MLWNRLASDGSWPRQMCKIGCRGAAEIKAGKLEGSTLSHNSQVLWLISKDKGKHVPLHVTSLGMGFAWGAVNNVAVKKQKQNQNKEKGGNGLNSESFSQ